MNTTSQPNDGATRSCAPVAGSVPPIPSPADMTDEYLVNLALQKYACACDPRCTRELHEWAMALRLELIKRINRLREDSARLDWLQKNDVSVMFSDREEDPACYNVIDNDGDLLGEHACIRGAIDRAIRSQNTQAEPR